MQFKDICRHLIAISVFTAFIGGVRATASTVTLAWDPPTHNTDGTLITNLAGYVVSYGTQSGGYENSVDVGNVTSHTLPALVDGSNYYATVQAYNTFGMQSDDAQELGLTAPDTLPPSISAPAQISLTGNAADQAEVPDVIAQATITDNVSARVNIAVSQNPLAGTLVGLGTTPVTLAATDEAGNTTEQIVELLVVAMNRPPEVMAGADQTTRLPSAKVTLDGTVTDDGLPEGSTVSVEWSMVSGPAAVVFNDANALSTTVTFTEAGSYVIRLTATDGELTATDDISVSVNPKPVPMPPNNLHVRQN